MCAAEKFLHLNCYAVSSCPNHFPKGWYYKNLISFFLLLMRQIESVLWAHPFRFLYLLACINF